MPNPSPNPELPEPDPSKDVPDSDDGLTEELVAFLDGELDPEKAEDMEARIQRDPKLRAEVDSLKQTWGLLDFLPKPEPSQSFTEQTLEKLNPISESGQPGPTRPIPQASGTGSQPTRSGPIPAPSGSLPTSPTVSASVAMMTPRSTLGWGVTAVILMLLFFGAGAAGYFIRNAVVGKPAPPETIQVDDYHLLKNLRWYQHIHDIEFLRSLDHPDLFGEEAVGL